MEFTWNTARPISEILKAHVPLYYQFFLQCFFKSHKVYFIYRHSDYMQGKYGTSILAAANQIAQFNIKIYEVLSTKVENSYASHE